MKERESTVNDPTFWDVLYRNGETGWDIGTPTPAFADLLARGIIAPGKTLVLGCGKGHDALLFAGKGFEVTAIDFSRQALALARSTSIEQGVSITFLERDMFTLSPEFDHTFDVVVEYVTYCAIDPGRRKEFASMIEKVLRPEGLLIALFFPLEERTDGPPFGIDWNEVMEVFGEIFSLEMSESPVNSISPRKGREKMSVWRKHQNP